MFFRSLHLVVLLASALAIVPTSPRRAAAQHLPAALQVPRDYALELRSSSLQLSPEVQAESELRQQLKRARRQLVIGGVLAVSGIVHAAAFGNRNVCYESDQRLLTPIIMGGLTAAVGVTLVISGGIKLAGIPLDYRLMHPTSASKRLGIAAGAIGLLAITQAALFSIGLPTFIGCVSS